MSSTTGYEKFMPSPPLPSPLFSKSSGNQESSTDSTATGFPLNSTSSYFDTTDVNRQPAVLPAKPKIRRPWSTGLCDCFSDCRNCCLTFWCPCITFGQIAEIIDKGSSSCGVNGALYALITCASGCACCYSCFYRAKMRQQYMLKEGPCGDCLVHCCCEYCALCQEYRELKNRGYDMTIGWQGNMEKQSREVEMDVSGAPVIEQGMSR